MGQHKNRTQVEIFLKFMEQHQDLARGFVKGDKFYYEQLWTELATQLNAAGPPSKEVSRWKKVWVDMKLSVKHRMAHNKTECSKAGGERVNKYILSQTDEQIAVICGLYATVERIKDAKSFGVPSTEEPTISKRAASAYSVTSSSNTSSDCIEINDDFSTILTSSSPVQACEKESRVSIPITPSSSVSANSRKQKDKITDGDIMEMESENSEITNAIKENRVYLKEISRNIRDIKKLKEKKLKELTRHNHEMEKSAQVKNELKLKSLELERWRLGLE